MKLSELNITLTEARQSWKSEWERWSAVIEKLGYSLESKETVIMKQKQRGFERTAKARKIAGTNKMVAVIYEKVAGMSGDYSTMFMKQGTTSGIEVSPYNWKEDQLRKYIEK